MRMFTIEVGGNMPLHTKVLSMNNLSFVVEPGFALVRRFTKLGRGMSFLSQRVSLTITRLLAKSRSNSFASFRICPM